MPLAVLVKMVFASIVFLSNTENYSWFSAVDRGGGRFTQFAKASAESACSHKIRVDYRRP